MNTTWRRKFSWSLQRQYYWDFCPRAYYYNYIREWEEGSDKEELIKLKQLRLWEEICSELLLEGIEKLVRGNLLSEVKEGLRDRLEGIFQSPQDFLVPGERDIYSSPHEIAALLSQYLENFLSLFQPSGSQGYFYRLKERIFYKGIPITVSPDFLFQSPEKIVVSKLIINPPQVSELLELQACSLILWAEERFEMGRENIFCDYYYLSDLRIERKNYTSEEIEKLADKIVLSTHKMLVVKGEQDFSARPDKERCSLCKFYSICPESMYSG